MKKYFKFSIILNILFALSILYGFKEINEISQKLYIGSAFIKDTLTSDLVTSRNLYPKDSIIFKSGANWGINSGSGTSQILFNASNGSLDFGMLDIRVHPGYSFTSLGGVNTGTLVAQGNVSVAGRLLGSQTTVASATTTTLGNANCFNVSGTTNIDQITVSGWTSGSIIILRFDDILTLDNKSGNSGQFELAGGVDFTTSANDIIMLKLSGTQWEEISRSIN